jgi:hypothetical protein
VGGSGYGVTFEHVPEYGATFEHVSFMVDGKDLRELVGEAERGSLIGLPREVALHPSRHLLDRPDPDFTIEGKQALFVCPICADLLCGAVTARIDVFGARVRWSEFERARWNHEGELWGFTALRVGPFGFDRAQYERALQQPSMS